MNLSKLQKSCKNLLTRVEYPRIAVIIGMQEELGKLAEIIMDLEIYNKAHDRKKLEKECSELFFSFIDFCNSYDIDLDKISAARIKEISSKIKKWEKEHGAILKLKKEKFN